MFNLILLNYSGDHESDSTYCQYINLATLPSLQVKGLKRKTKIVIKLMEQKHRIINSIGACKET